MSKVIQAGIVTAYGAAVRGGYTGTYDKFCQDLAELADVLSEFLGFRVTIETLNEGTQATASYNDGVLALGIPRGDTGNGIQRIERISTQGLVKTYRITYTNGTHFDFQVSDGNGIDHTTLNADYTLTITYTDGTTWTSGSIRGATGATPNLTIGTVETLLPSQSATATITGTPEDPVLNLGIPKGDTGEVSQAEFDELSGTVTELNRQISESITPAIEEIETALDGKAPVIINTTSGDIATFADGADGMPVKSLIANIEPVQDLHGYDYPWPAGGGKNLFHTIGTNQTRSGVTYTVDSDGTVLVNGTSTRTDPYTVGTVDLVGGTAYVISSGATNDSAFYLQAIGDGIVSINTISGAMTFTPQADMTATIRIVVSSGKAVSNVTIKPMICLSTATDPTVFAPYSNICPISGHTECTVGVVGVNWLPDNLTFIDGLRDDNGGQTSSGVSHYSEPFPIRPNTLYRATGTIWIRDTNPRIYFLDANKNWISRTAQFTQQAFNFTTPENCYYIQVQCSKDVDCTAGMISLDQSAAVTPYVGNTSVTISWQSEAGTVYGGTLDVTNGVLTVDKAMYEPSLPRNIQRNTAYSYYATPAVLPGIKNVTQAETSIISNKFKSEISGARGICFLNPGGNLRFNTVNEYNTVDEMFAGETPIQFIYPLATPVTYQLTPQQLDTLLGTNNIWADTGDTTVEYPADTKLYIDGKIAEAIAAALNA